MGAAALLALGVALWIGSDVLRQLAVWCLIALGSFYLAHVALSAQGAARRGSVDLSYGVYIYAFPMQQAVTEWSLQRGWPLWVCMGASLGLVLALAWLSWFGVERPCIRAAQKRQIRTLSTLKRA